MAQGGAKAPPDLPPFGPPAGPPPKAAPPFVPSPAGGGLTWRLTHEFSHMEQRYFHDRHLLRARALLTPVEHWGQVPRLQVGMLARLGHIELTPDGVRFWFILNRVYDVHSGALFNVWWACDARQAYVFR